MVASPTGPGSLTKHTTRTIDEMSTYKQNGDRDMCHPRQLIIAMAANEIIPLQLNGHNN
jgi:hypothetical protein